LAAIDVYHFLFIDKSFQHIDQTFTIYLLHLDYFKLEVNLLDSSCIIGHYVKTIVDYDNFQKFVVVAHRVSVNYFCSFNLVNSKLALEKEEMAWIGFDSSMYSHGIKGKFLWSGTFGTE
jgi:hypothetical protein